MESIAPNKAYTMTSPLPYTLVTSLDKDNNPNALAVSWITRTSINPFLILISIDFRRYSYEGIDYHKEFVINYPNENQVKGAEICGSKSGRDMDKIKEAGFTLVSSQKVKTPTIEDSTVSLECKLIDKFDTGDHTVFVGEVLAASYSPDNQMHIYSASSPSIISLDNKGHINLEL